MSIVSQEIIDLDKKLYDEYINKHVPANKGLRITYGTAGFRSNANYLQHICLRVGIFQGLITKFSEKECLGIVITASHNPVEDNGLKQSDFDGAMIRKDFENLVDVFVQEQDLNKGINDVLAVLTKMEGFVQERNGLLFIGRDTRPHSLPLSNLIKQGAEAVGTKVVDFGQVTTPMVHYMVYIFNKTHHSFTRDTPAEEMILTYHSGSIKAYHEFMQCINYKKKEDETILLDCANGIGGIQVTQFVKALENEFNIQVINPGDVNHLNDHCGAEHVHKSLADRYPTHSRDFLEGKDLSKIRGISFDGDADRVLYYLYQPGLKDIILMDGDRIIVMFAVFFKTVFNKLQDLANKINSKGVMSIPQNFGSWRIGMVQTAYANGSSTHYMKNSLKVEQVFTANGVKNLHPAAITFDVGCYCESNGHLTYHMDHDKQHILEIYYNQKDAYTGNDDDVQEFFKQITLAYCYAKTQNQIMGDAMTNFMCVEEALAYLGITIQDWANYYTDKQCQNAKFYVKNKSNIKVNKTEDHIDAPVDVQNQIDAIVKKYGEGCRSFARPSGTEDYVRVYAEADDIEVVKQIIQEVGQMLSTHPEIN